MKKLIAISVMLTLIAGAAFAQTVVGGNVRMGLQLLAGDSVEGSEIGAGRIEIFDMVTNVSFGDSLNGGMMRLYAKMNQWEPALFGFLFFRPIEQIRIQIGQNPDNDFGSHQISGWGFNAEAQGGAALDQHRLLNGVNIPARTAGWYGGFGDLGLAISIFPVPDLLTFNLGIPFVGPAQDSTFLHNRLDLNSTYLRTHIQAVVDIEDIGAIRATAQLRGLAANDDFLIPNIFASFYLTAIEGMGLDIGFAYRKPNTTGSDIVTSSAADVMVPEIGLGFRFTADSFNIKLRAGAVIAETYTDMGIHILPSYTINNLTILLNAGFGLRIPDADVDPTIGWFVNPYITTTFGPIRFYGGFQLFDNGAGHDNAPDGLNWAIPISFNVYF